MNFNKYVNYVFTQGNKENNENKENNREKESQ